MSSKRATLELVDVENAPPQEGIAFTTVLQQIPQVFTNQYVDSSNMNLALETLNYATDEISDAPNRAK